jgi:hypothetical protein
LLTSVPFAQRLTRYGVRNGEVMKPNRSGQSLCYNFAKTIRHHRVQIRKSAQC